MLLRLSCAFFMLFCVAGCPGHSPSLGMLPSPSAAALVRPTAGSTGKIKHVIVIVQENRTVENLFAGFHGANAPMYGYAFHNGHRVHVTLHQTTFETDPNLPHTWQDAIADWDNGKMDGFHTGRGQHFGAYAFLDHAEIAPYWAMAKQYVLADEMFPTEFGGSYEAHIMAVAGNDDITATQALVNFPTHAPNDCDSPPGTKSSLVDSNRRVGVGNGPFPCYTQFNTMAQVLDAGHVSWKYYVARHMNGGIYSPFEAVSYVRYGNDWDADVIAPETTVLSDIAHHKLAQVTWVTPAHDDSDHPGVKSDKGPSWVASIVNAIGQSRYWDSSAIVIIWDDWGGWYDNAPPPQPDFRGLGIRVPCIIVSPYAKIGHTGKGYVSHTQYEYGSILKFIEESFGLPAIGPPWQGYTDSRAASLSDAFNFNQSPRAFTPFQAKYPASYFMHKPPSNAPLDDE